MELPGREFGKTDCPLAVGLPGPKAVKRWFQTPQRRRLAEQNALGLPHHRLARADGHWPTDERIEAQLTPASVEYCHSPNTSCTAEIAIPRPGPVDVSELIGDVCRYRSSKVVRERDVFVDCIELQV